MDNQFLKCYRETGDETPPGQSSRVRQDCPSLNFKYESRVHILMILRNFINKTCVPRIKYFIKISE